MDKYQPSTTTLPGLVDDSGDRPGDLLSPMSTGSSGHWASPTGRSQGSGDWSPAPSNRRLPPNWASGRSRRVSPSVTDCDFTGKPLVTTEAKVLAPTTTTITVGEFRELDQKALRQLEKKLHELATEIHDRAEELRVDRERLDTDTAEAAQMKRLVLAEVEAARNGLRSEQREASKLLTRFETETTTKSEAFEARLTSERAALEQQMKQLIAQTVTAETAKLKPLRDTVVQLSRRVTTAQEAADRVAAGLEQKVVDGAKKKLRKLTSAFEFAADQKQEELSRETKVITAAIDAQIRLLAEMKQTITDHANAECGKQATALAQLITDRKGEFTAELETVRTELLDRLVSERKAVETAIVSATERKATLEAELNALSTDTETKLKAAQFNAAGVSEKAAAVEAALGRIDQRTSAVTEAEARLTSVVESATAARTEFETALGAHQAVIAGIKRQTAIWEKIAAEVSERPLIQLFGISSDPVSTIPWLEVTIEEVQTSDLKNRFRPDGGSIFVAAPIFRLSMLLKLWRGEEVTPTPKERERVVNLAIELEIPLPDEPLYVMNRLMAAHSVETVSQEVAAKLELYRLVNRIASPGSSLLGGFKDWFRATIRSPGVYGLSMHRRLKLITPGWVGWLKYDAKSGVPKGYQRVKITAVSQETDPKLTIHLLSDRTDMSLTLSNLSSGDGTTRLIKEIKIEGVDTPEPPLPRPTAGREPWRNNESR